MSGTENLDLKVHGPAACAEPRRERCFGGKKERLKRVSLGSFSTESPRGSCEAASNKRVLVKIKRTDSATDPENFCSEPTMRTVKFPCESWRYFLTPQRKVGELYKFLLSKVKHMLPNIYKKTFMNILRLIFLHRIIEWQNWTGSQMPSNSIARVSRS